MCLVVCNFKAFRPTGHRFVSLNQIKILPVEFRKISVHLLYTVVTNLRYDFISELILQSSRILSSVWSLSSTNRPTTVCVGLELTSSTNLFHPTLNVTV